MQVRELNKGDTVFRQGDASNEMYVLQEGMLEVVVKDKRGREKKISDLSEKNAIFGQIGALLKQPRNATIRAVNHSVVQSIDTRAKALDETILAAPKLGLSLSMNLAHFIKETNTRLSLSAQFLADLRKTAQEYLRYYYDKSKSIGEIHQRIQAPWARNLFEKTKSHPCYAMGELLSQGSDPMPAEAVSESPAASAVSIPDTVGQGRDYESGQAVCREGEEGRDFFILKTGLLEIQVGGRKMAEIRTPGEVIGEVAVLAGYRSRKFEKRSATIVAREASNIVVVDGSHLETTIVSNPALILYVTKILAGRLPGTNQALMIDEDQIGKYMSLLTHAGDTKTIMSAYDLLRINLQSLAKDKTETDGFQEEVTARQTELSNRIAVLTERHEELVSRWKSI